MSWLIYFGDILGRLGMELVGYWLTKIKKDREMVQAYYEFLSQVDKSGAEKVANYLAAEDALAAKQKEIKERLESERSN